MLWTEPESPRIWRHVSSNVQRDEVLDAAAVYTDEVLAGIAREGFTGVWLFGRLYDLMRSSVFPELNRPGRDERIASLRALIDRAARHGIGVYGYFNDPVGLPADHPFWHDHPHLKGATKWNQYSLCTSTPEVRAFFRDAVTSAMEGLGGLAGVFLITACESLTHCWSKCATRRGQAPPACERCRGREPADLVLELLGDWVGVRRRQARPWRLIAWNWEWAYWYPDPQAEIVGRLPEGVELLLDVEIGGTRRWRDRLNYIGEYSLSYTGPSERFTSTCRAVRGRGIPVHAKIQLNNTHELCTVPNVPVIHHLHQKFRAIVEHDAAGFLGTWSMGADFTLNTAAMRLFKSDPGRFMDRDVFLDALARDYFGLECSEPAVRAWAGFCEAFRHYPFSVRLLYNGPHNDAPARPLSLRYDGRPSGRSFAADPLGDDLSACLAPHHCDQESFTLDEVIDGFESMCELWDRALPDYEEALEGGAPAADADRARRRRDELRCARMIAVQLRSAFNAFRFYREQMRAMARAGLKAPCKLPPDPALLAIMREEVENAGRALPLVEADARLGFHQEFQGYKYDAAGIRAKLRAMRAELENSTGNIRMTNDRIPNDQSMTKPQ